jgi:hypothetical protein
MGKLSSRCRTSYREPLNIDYEYLRLSKKENSPCVLSNNIFV